VEERDGGDGGKGEEEKESIYIILWSLIFAHYQKLL